MLDNADEFTIRLSLEGLLEEIRVIPSSEDEQQKFLLYQESDYLGTVWPECVDDGVC